MLLPFPRTPASPPVPPSRLHPSSTAASPTAASPPPTTAAASSPSAPPRRPRRHRTPPASSLRSPHLSSPSPALLLPEGAAPALRTLLAFAPARYRDCDLSLAFSTVRDGCSLASFYARLATPVGEEHVHAPLLLAVRDSGGAVFGAFVVDGALRPRVGYFGSGETFVFRKETGDQFHVYPWSRKNNWFQLVSAGSIAVGGGGAFAFSLDDMIEKGTSGQCETFDSPCLASTVAFECVVFEAWRLVPPGLSRGEDSKVER